MPNIIKQTVTFKVSPHEVYETLMDSKKHTKFSGSTAKISRVKGGRFEAYDGYCEGINIKLIPDKKIVQSWRASDWPDGHYSTATFEFKKDKNGCRMTFTQTDVPANQIDSIKQGWVDYYWKPMKQMLED